ncbi:hypothetical protein [Burkholderia cepacia]|uniref:hypothetical protein n=1 Tax=Burkholderia cepacia TaxID=292 RepID=UPI002AB70B86|nr:hypothetical protein [Burkholderia cepacia]
MPDTAPSSVSPPVPPVSRRRYFGWAEPVRAASERSRRAGAMDAGIRDAMKSGLPPELQMSGHAKTPKNVR